MRIKTAIGLILGLLIITGCSTTATINANTAASGANGGATKENKPAATPSESKKTAETTQSKLTELYDGRKDFDYKDYSKSEMQPVQAEFDRKKAEIKEKFGERYCSEGEDQELSLNGIAEGAFTKPSTQQKAYLYTLCSTGSSHFGVGGIMIFENGRVVTHYTYGENGLDSGLLKIADINKDGMDELALIDGQTHQGYSNGSFSLVEFPNGKLNFIGLTEVYSDNSGAAEDDNKILAEASVISVEPGATPVFYKDSYEQKGSSKNWTPVKKAEKFSLNKMEDEYLKGYRKISD